MPVLQPIAIFALALALAASTWGEDSQQKLESLNAKLEQLQSRIRETRGARKENISALRRSEIQIGRISAELLHITREITASTQALSHLETRESELLQQEQEQQGLLLLQIRESWLLGLDNPIKRLLNQNNPADFSRLLGYSLFLNQERRQLLEEYRQTRQDLNNTALAIAGKREALATQRAKLTERQVDLQKESRQRSIAIASLDSRLKSDQAKAEEYAAQRKELEAVLELLDEAIADLAVPKGKAFATLKGQLPWPIAGKPRNRFGSRRGTLGMKWQGLELRVKSGEPVKSIHDGRIVYANWLRGHGLITIIDHGDGFMSLYGNNENLLRDAGEWVAAGEIIATTGVSGGRASPTLYFEIRQQGNPVNPQDWCRS